MNMGKSLVLDSHNNRTVSKVCKQSCVMNCVYFHHIFISIFVKITLWHLRHGNSLWHIMQRAIYSNMAMYHTHLYLEKSRPACGTEVLNQWGHHADCLWRKTLKAFGQTASNTSREQLVRWNFRFNGIFTDFEVAQLNLSIPKSN